jgi:hypothetical protein
VLPTFKARYLGSFDIQVVWVAIKRIIVSELDVERNNVL